METSFLLARRVIAVTQGNRQNIKECFSTLASTPLRVKVTFSFIIRGKHSLFQSIRSGDDMDNYTITLFRKYYGDRVSSLGGVGRWMGHKVSQKEMCQIGKHHVDVQKRFLSLTLERKESTSSHLLNPESLKNKQCPTSPENCRLGALGVTPKLVHSNNNRATPGTLRLFC